MGTHRLDFSCSFPRLEVPISQSAKPATFPVKDRPLIEGKSNHSLKRNACASSAMAPQAAIRTPSERWEKRNCMKRSLEQSSSDDSYASRGKKRARESSQDFTEKDGQSSANQLIDIYHSEPLERESVVGIPGTVLVLSTIEEGPCMHSSETLLPKANCLGSVVTERSEHGEHRYEVATRENPKDSSLNWSSSETRSSSQDDEESSEKATGDGSENYCQSEGTEAGDDDVIGQGLELVNLLVSCTQSISSKNFALVNHYLSKLGDLASPKGTPIHRVAACFTEAMALRAANLWPHIFRISIQDLEQGDEDLLVAFRLLNNISPIPKFLQFTANEMILRAFEDKDRIHIIDFDIKQGLQWPTLFQSLVSRPKPPTRVRITGIGESKQELQDTGNMLAGLAGALNLQFEFHAVVDKLEDVRLWMLHVKENESVAVNCMMQMHRLLIDSDGSILRNFLGLIQSVRPTILVIAEQESSHNLSWEARFCNSLAYYSAIFDSIDASLPQDSLDRAKIEQMFAREIRNIIAYEGAERTERHECFETWKRVLEVGGFRCSDVSDREVIQGKMLLKMFLCENYKVVKQGEGGLTLCWAEQPLFTVSAWAAAAPEIAGTSPSSSQPE
ncbi:scarecrow-like protein 28 [Nymphaea colorata]|uniref:Uncharacterized protein n=1 Tax=Nymphaea colorata TaxID=210225 RepID=A0A5K1ATU8_9MAGN|nr:scarecrow-like protein 28 [Nymphaea colorata]